MQTEIWRPFNLVTFTPSSASPSERLVATHPLEEQQGFAFLPRADPVLTNYLQSMHQSWANPHIWGDLPGHGKPGPPEPSPPPMCVKRERRNVTQNKGRRQSIMGQLLFGHGQIGMSRWFLALLSVWVGRGKGGQSGHPLMPAGFG